MKFYDLHIYIINSCINITLNIPASKIIIHLSKFNISRIILEVYKLLPYKRISKLEVHKFNVSF